MLIAFDCRIIRDKNPAGISRVTLEFLKKVLSADRKNDYILLFDNEDLKDFVCYYLRNVKKKVRVVIVPFGIFSVKNILNLSDILKDRMVDVYYCPNYFCPPFMHRSIKVVITVFDLIHFFYPYLKMSLARRMYHRIKIAPKMVFRRADKIITISVSTSRDLVKTFKISPRKIKMIYMGVSENFRVVRKDLAQKMMEEKYGVKNYILYVGRNEPHKNIKALIIAYKYLPDYLKEKYRLILVGKEDKKYAPALHDLVRKHGLSQYVIFTGYVDEADLPYIYSGAAVYVQPSFYEGFGLPILEAMACGIPVVSSNSSSLPEVGSDAALYFDPYDVRKLAEHLTNILDDEGLRKEMTEKGLKQVRNFSWFNSANSLLECFQELGGNNEKGK